MKTCRHLIQALWLGIPLSCFFLLSACSTLPPELDSPGLQPITLGQAMEDPEHYRGKRVRWGGKILELTNDAQDTWVQILAYPLDNAGRPKENATPLGRFVVHTSAFLDPAIYLPEKELTVVGTLAGLAERTVGKRKIKIPLLEARSWHLWPKRKQTPPPAPPPYWWYDPWWGGCYRSYWCW